MSSIKYRNQQHSWNKGQWTDYFVSISLPETIPGFTGTTLDRLKGAAAFFHENGFDTYSGIELTAAANLNRDDTPVSNSRQTRTYSAISSHYSDYREIAQELQMPLIHLLRIESGSNRSNLHQTRGYEIKDGMLVKERDEIVYPDLKISKSDWQEGITLPLPNEYDFETAKLFGIYWGIAALPKTDVSPTLILSGPESLEDTLRQEVKPLMESIHNIRVLGTDQSDEDPVYVKRGEDEIILQGYFLARTSRALTSFLTTEHDFPEAGEGRAKKHLPNIPWSRDNIDGFVMGLVLVRGNDGSYDTGHGIVDHMEINGEGNYRKELSSLLTVRQFGHGAPYLREGRNSWSIKLNRAPTLHFRELMRQRNAKSD
jgi:hypothetical protein